MTVLQFSDGVDDLYWNFVHDFFKSFVPVYWCYGESSNYNINRQIWQDITLFQTNKTIWPYFWLTPVTIFWTIAGISLPLMQEGYFKKYSHIPVLTYSQAFYDSDAFNEKSATDHPFASAYKYSSVFFNNQSAVIGVLICFLVVQIIFWLIAVYAYVPIFSEFCRNRRKNVKEL